jgi:hypothetical protein
MNKAKQGIEMFSEFNSKGYDSLRQLTEISLKAWHQTLDKQFAAYTNQMKAGLDQLTLIAQAKEYQDVVRGQIDLTRTIGEEMVSKTRDVVELSQKTGEEIRGWFEGNLSTLNEQLSKAFEKAA